MKIQVEIQPKFDIANQLIQRQQNSNINYIPNKVFTIKTVAFESKFNSDRNMVHSVFSRLYVICILCIIENVFYGIIVTINVYLQR